MTDKTYAFRYRCPRCWRAALFTDTMPIPGTVWDRRDFYDAHGNAAVPGPGLTTLCPLCGGYLQASSACVTATMPHEDPRRAH